MWKKIFALAIFLTSLNASVTIYEDAEDLSTTKWSIFDNDPAGASVENILDTEKNSQVIQLNGTSYDNGFSINNSDGSAWDDETNFFVEWSHKTTDSYIVYVVVSTDNGDRFISYCNCLEDSVVQHGTSTVSHGLGSDTKDGTWQTFQRDLQADLNDIFPDDTILAVRNMLFRMNGLVDDIKLGDGEANIEIPVTPSDLNTSTIGTNSITLTWNDNSDNESGFKVIRDGELIHTTEADVTTYTDENLTAGVTYAYEIIAMNETGDSEAASIEVTTMEDIVIPTAPSDLNATDVTASSITLNWNDNSDNESGFKIVRDGELIHTTEADVTTYTDINLTAGVTYLYEIKATNEAGDSDGVIESVTTETEITIPNDPSDINVSEVGTTSVAVGWIDNSDNENGFKIFKNDLLVFTTEANATNYFDTNLTPGTEYLYMVKATNEAGDSEGISINVTTEEEIVIPNTPGDLNATDITTNSVTLNWIDNSLDESGFKILRDGEVIHTTEADITTYTDSNTTNATTYEYEVIATNAAGDSESISISVTTAEEILIPAAPTELNATDIGTKSVTLNWIDNSIDENGFVILRDDEVIFTTEANATSYIDSEIEEATTYTYEVRATNEAGESEGISIEVTTESGTAKAPTELNATSPGSYSIELTWIDNSDNETGFKVIRDGETIHTTEVNVTSYLDTNLTPETEYQYKVIAVNEFGDSEPAIVTTTTKAEDPEITYVKYLYQTVLERDYEEEGLNYWSQRLRDGDSAAKIAKGFFVITNELSSQGLSNEEYIRKLFITLHQTEPLTRELAYWVNILDEHILNRDLVFCKLVFSKEFVALAESYNLKPFDENEMLMVRIQSLYYIILNRSANEGELGYWVDKINAGTRSYEDIVRDFFNSSEFDDRNMSDADFVTAVYRSILDREPESVGHAYWENRLLNGTTRAQVIDEIFASPEYEWLNSL